MSHIEKCVLNNSFGLDKYAKIQNLIEEGLENLYMFSGNRPSGSYDLLGLEEVCDAGQDFVASCYVGMNWEAKSVDSNGVVTRRTASGPWPGRGRARGATCELAKAAAWAAAISQATAEIQADNPNPPFTILTITLNNNFSIETNCACQ
jgi:hypothetical protein